MLNIELTKVRFGYKPIGFSDGCHKRVVVTCDYCGNNSETAYKNYMISYKNTVIKKDCCMKCRSIKAKECNSARDRTEIIKIAQQKAAITNMERYGVEFGSQSDVSKNKVKRNWSNKTQEELDIITEKREQTLLNEYGKTQSEMSRDANIEKWGHAHIPVTDEIKDKRKATMIEKFGVEYAGQSLELIKKTKQTNLERIGYESIFQTPEFIARNKELNIGHTPESNQKRKDTNIERYGFESVMQNPDIIAKGLATRRKTGDILLYDGKTIEEWALEKDVSRSWAAVVLREYGIEKMEILEKGRTDIEMFIKTILDKNNIKYIEQPSIENKRGDFLVDNLIIECDGEYWHSEENKGRNYHKDKRNIYIKNGYDCLFFWGNEIILKSNIVESVILNRLGLTKNRIFARKCQTQEISKSQAKDFMIHNHLMGFGRGRAFGLFHDEVLVSVIQVNQRFNEGIEISRFCNILNTNVVGGFSKLLKYIENTLCPEKIITFIDLRYGKVGYLTNLGFDKVTEYVSFKWNHKGATVNRMTFPGNSGYKEGFTKIWDCGQAKWVKTCR